MNGVRLRSRIVKRERQDAQVTEDQLGNVNALLRVHLDRNSASVVHDRDGLGGSVDGDLEGVHVGVVDLRVRTDASVYSPSELGLSRTHLVVRRVDENLIEDLEKAGYERDLSENAQKR